MPTRSSLHDLEILTVHALSDIPVLSRQVHALHRVPMDRDWDSFESFLRPYPHGSRLVHR